MRTSFGRSFSAIATILLLALTVLGASFQIIFYQNLEGSTQNRQRQQQNRCNSRKDRKSTRLNSSHLN